MRQLPGRGGANLAHRGLAVAVVVSRSEQVIHASSQSRAGLAAVPRLWPLVVLIPLAGCNELLEPHPPAGVAVERGSGQIATVGTELADSLVVRVVDAIGRPVADVPVR